MHKINLTSPTTPTLAIPDEADLQPNVVTTPDQAPSPEAQPTMETAVDQTSSLDNNQASEVVVPAAKLVTKKTEKTMAKSSHTIGLIIAALIAIVAGVGTGYGSSKLYAKNQGLPTGEIQTVATTGSINAGDVFGSSDTSNFKDSAKGYLEAGGLDNEGTHHLLREGGPSQTVYLTSSVTDLSKLEGMEVEIWGETFKGQTAGWLMDVGRIQVNAVEGVKPAEE